MRKEIPERRPAVQGWRAKLGLVLLLALITGGGVFWALQTCVGPRVVVLPEVRRVDLPLPGSTRPAATQAAATRPADAPNRLLR